MGDRRTKDRRVADRRVSERRIEDRRTTEKGIIKISVKKLIWYGIIVIIVTAFIVTCIFYIKDKIEEKNNENTGYYVTDQQEENGYQDEEEEIGYSCDVFIDGDKTEIKAGETVTYALNVANIKAEDGIIMFETHIDYDTNAFTCKTINDNDSGWNQASMIENYLTMTRKDLTPNSEDQMIIKLEFTAKEDIKIGEQFITFLDMKFTMDNDRIFSVDDQIATVEIVEK